MWLGLDEPGAEGGKGKEAMGEGSESLRIPDAKIGLGVRPVYPDP